jgi:hypothetical protein
VYLSHAHAHTHASMQGSGAPTLGLWVGQTGVAAVSNERGFTEKDVRALCDVGASSKLGLPVPNTSSNTAASRAGMDEREQTGEKGVGEWQAWTLPVDATTTWPVHTNMCRLYGLQPASLMMYRPWNLKKQGCAMTTRLVTSHHSCRLQVRLCCD